MKKICAICILLVFCASFCGCGQGVLSKNDLPMYGGLPRTTQEKLADDEFIAEMDRLGAEVDPTGARKVAVKKIQQAAWGFYNKGDYKMAMKRFNQVWLLDPNNADAFFGFAIIMEAYGKPEEAAKFYRKTLDLNPQADAMSSLATLLAKKAFNDLENAASLTEKENARKNLDDIFGMYEKSVELATNDSDKGMAYYQWAISLFMDKKYAESWKKIKLSRRYNGKFIRPYFIKKLSKKMPEPKE